jgi:hypothetical protein
MPRVRIRPSTIARTFRFGMLGTVVALMGLSVEATAQRAPSRRADAPVIYHKGRNFKIPFNLNAEGRSRIKEVRLLVSEDTGYNWRPVSKTFPDHQTFTFRSPRDGEYWFAVQTLTVDGKVSPALDATIEPSLKVIVDTLPPSLLLEPDGRRASTASVRWEVKDENLDLKSLALEYQIEGVGVWRRVPLPRPKLIGSQRWDAGTAEALKVRMAVADKAGNVTDAVIDLPPGTASASESTSGWPNELGPPGIEQISSAAAPRITAGPGFTPVNEDLGTRRPEPPARATQPGARIRDGAEDRPRPMAPAWDRDPGPPVASPPASALATGTVDRLALPDAATVAGEPGGPVAPTGVPVSTSQPSATAPASVRGNAPRSLLVDSPRFKLQYAVDDAGPSGPASVELWITQDGGRTWIRRGDDPDRASPMEIDLGGEGTYGLYLVARSAAGLGDQPPAPGDPPQSWVEVDATAPVVQLDAPQIGTGPNSGKIAISWRATDLHLDAKPISIFWRPDQPGAAWQPLAEGLENTGRFIWPVPPAVPPRFHIRVEAVDSVGHRGGAETTETGAVVIDRSRPRSRIIGLDPNARSGMGPGAWPVR